MPTGLHPFYDCRPNRWQELPRRFHSSQAKVVIALVPRRKRTLVKALLIVFMIVIQYDGSRPSGGCI